MRPQTRHQIYFRCSWFQWLAATVLVGSVLPSPIFAQVDSEVPRPAITNQATYTYTDSASKKQFQGISSQTEVKPLPRVDPRGRILACGGEALPDYQGFSVGLYEPDRRDPTGSELGNLVTLTRTELPDIPNNNVPAGKAPNGQNINPFFLTNADSGTYTFLLNPQQGQVVFGRVYLLVVNPPPNSIYSQRRIKIEFVGNPENINDNLVRYVATSLDGQPLSIKGNSTFEGVVSVSDAEREGIQLLALPFTTGLCQAEQIQIIKTGDRAAAEPGDTAIYRLSVKNLADVDLNNLVVTDNLPLGFKFLPKSVRGELQGQPVNITSERNGSTVQLRTEAAIPPLKVLNIAYAAQLTPDALRGSGRNSAIVNGQRLDNGFRVKDGPATHQLQIRPGIVADCGTIIGRVFVDKNFDGEQQPGEPGIPNAVIFMEDGNRISTDVNGLFSVANVLPGSHTGVLDLSSVPGYTLAANVYFRERNSQSRLVRMEPGGMVRMNFAVTPTFQEEAHQ